MSDRRDYYKKYYQANKSKWQGYQKTWRYKKDKARQRVLQYLKENPCISCGEKDVVVLEFHHTSGQKVTEVNRMLLHGWSWSKIKKEISKCEVLCANCHQKKTSQKKRCWKVVGIPYHKPTRAKCYSYIQEYLLRNFCVDCGESDMVVLQFDHNHNKVAPVSALAGNGVSIEILAKEIEKCDVRCANCHKRKTTIDRSWWRVECSAI